MSSHFLQIPSCDLTGYVIGYGISDEAATDNALAVLDKAIGNHGRPASIMTDHGSRFYANKRDRNVDARGRFEMRLAELGMCNTGRRKPSPDKQQAGAPARRDTVQAAPVRGDNDEKERSHGLFMQWYNTSGPTCHLTGTTRRRRYRRL